MTQPKKKKNNIWIYLGIGLLILLFAAALMKDKTGSKGEKVEIKSVKRHTILETVGASGKVFPSQEVKISSDVSGEVVELFVEEGDSVKIGQLLAKVDPDAYQSAVERGIASVNSSKAQWANAKAGILRQKAMMTQARAQLEQTKSQLKNIKSIFERNKLLFQDGVISQASFEDSKSKLESMQANVRSSEASLSSAEANLESSKQSAEAAKFTVNSSNASLKELRTNLKKTNIYAPMNGVISALNIEKGERVVGTMQMAGTEMMRIADLSSIEVQVDVNENDVLKVRKGDEVDIEVDAYMNKKFKGKVKEIANSASGQGGGLTSDKVINFVVKIQILAESYSDLIKVDGNFPFRPGMSASVDIFTEKSENVISVPIQAVTIRAKNENKDDDDRLDDEVEVVFQVLGDTVKQIEVKTGIQDDTYIEILSGLSEDDKIAVGPYRTVTKKLETGMEIKEIDKKKEKE